MKFHYVTREKIEKIPKTTGVYSFTDTKGAVLYIGKAAHLRNRVKNHFQQPSYRDHLFLDQIRRVGYIETQSEIEALLLESQLIKHFKPRHNIMWRDDKGYFFVGITKENLPRVFLNHQPTDETRGIKHEAQKQKKQVSQYIGPFTDGRALKRTLRTLRRVFPYYTAKKHGPRPCQYCNLELCPGPSADEKEYRKNIKHLVAVLESRKPAVLAKLKREMALASNNQEYEKAGKLRDQIRDLEIVFSHAKILQQDEQKLSINWRDIEAYLHKTLQTTQPICRVEAYDISNIHGKEATGSMPVFIEGKPAKEHYRKFKVRIAGKPNDFAMLKEVISRRLAHPEWPYPDLIVIDGGKGQLTAALQALQNFQFPISNVQTNSNLKCIKIVAIAKKHNELFLPGKSKPLLLRDMPASVANFILHMRDEAHRFAISYHRLLRRLNLLKKPATIGKYNDPSAALTYRG